LLQDGFDKDGYDRERYDIFGYRDGYDREGYDKEGYDETGYNRCGHGVPGHMARQFTGVTQQQHSMAQHGVNSTRLVVKGCQTSRLDNSHLCWAQLCQSYL
jgi:hypothetical protein